MPASVREMAKATVVRLVPMQQPRQQQPQARDAAREQQDAHDEREHAERKQQRQQNENIQRQHAAQAHHRADQRRRSALRFPAAQARLGAQLARQALRVTQRAGHLLFRSAGGRSFVEVRAVVGDDVVDFLGRHARQGTSQLRDEFGPGHRDAPSARLIDATKSSHSAFCAAKAVRPVGVNL